MNISFFNLCKLVILLFALGISFSLPSKVLSPLAIAQEVTPTSEPEGCCVIINNDGTLNKMKGTPVSACENLGGLFCGDDAACDVTEIVCCQIPSDSINNQYVDNILLPCCIIALGGTPVVGRDKDCNLIARPTGIQQIAPQATPTPTPQRVPPYYR